MNDTENQQHPALPENDGQDSSVTMPLPQVQRSAAVSTETRKIVRSELFASRTGQLIQMTSTQLLRYITGKKRLPAEDDLSRQRFGRTEGRAFRWGTEAGDLPDIEQFYRKIKVIGEGGQGIVYDAEDLMLGRHLAIKSLRREWLNNEDARRSFVTEARVTAALEHPSVIPVHLLGSDGENGLHLAMKYQKGQSFQHYLEQVCRCYRHSGTAEFDEAASLQKRLDIIIRCCEALSFAHAKGIIHCDLKPENILIGEYNETYIMDWGIARQAGADLPPEGHILGTPRYTSPENLARLACDGRSDLYSMGVILFEAVTLSPAFRGKTPQAIVQKVANGRMEPLRHRFKLPISRDLAKIIRKATALVPADRYGSVMELAEDLRRWQRGDEVRANPDNWFGRIIRWGGRHSRSVFLLSSAFVIVTLVLSIFSAFRHIAYNMMVDKVRSETVMEMFSSHRQTVREIDAQFSLIEKRLTLFNTAMAAVMVDGERLSARPSRNALLVESGKLARHTVDFNRISYRQAPGSDAAQFASVARRMNRVVPLLNRVLASSEKLIDSTSEEQAQQYRDGTCLVRSIYVGFHQGLLLDYPANGEPLPPQYDPRKQSWYELAMNNNFRIVWGLPYADAGANGMMLVTCSQEIWRTGRQAVGVTAIDVPLRFLLMRMSSGLKNGVLSRGLLTTDGVLIVEAQADAGTGKIVYRAGDKGAISQSELRKMKAIGEGFFFEQIDGRTTLWVFSQMHTTGWLYFERVDFDRTMASSVQL